DHSAGDGIEGFGEGFGADPELADPVLIDLHAQALHRLVPVEIDQPGVRVLPDRLGNKERRVAGAFRGLAADAILQWPANRWPQFQRVDSGVETGELAVEFLLQPRPDNFALRDALG